jgi:hypothetical protein
MDFNNIIRPKWLAWIVGILEIKKSEKESNKNEEFVFKKNPNFFIALLLIFASGILLYFIFQYKLNEKNTTNLLIINNDDIKLQNKNDTISVSFKIYGILSEKKTAKEQPKKTINNNSVQNNVYYCQDASLVKNEYIFHITKLLLISIISIFTIYSIAKFYTKQDNKTDIFN